MTKWGMTAPPAWGSLPGEGPLRGLCNRVFDRDSAVDVGRGAVERRALSLAGFAVLRVKPPMWAASGSYALHAVSPRRR
jgi:hypothetical protein